MTTRWVPLRGLLMAFAVLSSACSSGDSLHSIESGSRSTEPPPTNGSNGHDTSTTTRESGDKSSFYLKAADQSSDGNVVVINEAAFPGTTGWIAIHAFVRAGELGPIIGVSDLLPAGTNTGVEVVLSEPLRTSASVFPMLHVESTNNATFDFPSGDPPAVAEGVEALHFPIRVYVVKQTR